MEDETKPANGKANAKKLADATISLALIPISPKNQFMPLALFASIAMFILDYNAIVSIPWFITWLPVIVLFTPLLLLTVIAGAIVAVWMLVMLGISLLWLVAMLSEKAFMFLRRQKMRNSLKKTHDALKKATKSQSPAATA